MDFKDTSSEEHLTNIRFQDTDILAENSSEQQKPNKWVIGRRYIGAFFIYLLYWLTIGGALKQAADAILSPEKDEELMEAGAINSCGYGDHYIWFLIALCFTTYCSAVLAGATAKKKGAVVVSVANLPIAGLWFFACFLVYTSRTEMITGEQIAWKIVLSISVLASVFLSAAGGLAGEKWQKNMFKNNSILGIRPIHWWWLIFPLGFVIIEIIPKIVFTLALLFGSLHMKETKYSILMFLEFAVFATFVYFAIWGWLKTFQLLSVENKTTLGKVRIVLNVIFYLWGIPILFDIICVLIAIFTRRFVS